MLIETMRAAGSAEALALVRERLGPDAHVLEMRRVADGVEIVAVAERPRARRDDGAPALVASHAPSPLVDALVARGFHPMLAARIDAAHAGMCRDAAHDLEAGLRFARRFLAERLPRHESPASGRARVLALVGAPGVGKTTTIAKLAARMSLTSNQSIALASADDVRLGGLEQLQAFADVLDVPFARVGSARDLARLRRELPPQATLLVDTPGVAACDAKTLANVQRLLARTAPSEIEVLVAADADRAAIERVLARFAPLRPGALGITRCDEAARPGAALSAVIASRLPLAHASNGPRVPDDLFLPDPERIALWALPDTNPPGTTAALLHTETWE